jgi:glutamate synthase (NADPH/NADH) small chain
MAYFLTLKGHKVVVFDSLPGGGGMMRIGPPLYRLPIEAIDKDVNHIASLGVEFRFNTTVGKDILFEDILKEYDAIYLGIGTTVSRSTKVKNIDKAHLALPFLQANKIAKPVKVGKEVIVIGGGNVAMDVAREALRLQHIQYPGENVITKTISLEDWDQMPATEDEIEEAKAEGIQFNPAWGPKEVKVEDGKIKGLLCMKVKSVFDEQGRFSPTFYEEKQMFLEGDMIIEAIGQAPDFLFIPKEIFEKLEFTPNRKVKVDENGMTTIPALFAGGDIVNPNLDAVTAIADAKIAAEGIHKMLFEG